MNSWLMVCLLLLGLFLSASAQETEGPTDLEPREELNLTNSTPTLNDPGVADDLPVSVEGLWLLVIMIITPLLTAALGKIPSLPRPVLTLIGPALGLGLGFLLDYMNAQNFVWWHVAGAAALATSIREIVNQWVTKRLKPLELSKTKARPIDSAVALNENLPTIPTREEAREIQAARVESGINVTPKPPAP